MLSCKMPPTFPAKVDIPVPGAAPETITVDFIYRTRDQLVEFVDKEMKSLDDRGLVLAVAKDWAGVEQPFDADGVLLVTQTYPKATAAIWERYMAELGPALLGN